MKTLKQIIFFSKYLCDKPELVFFKPYCNLFQAPASENEKNTQAKLVLSVSFITGVNRIRPTTGICYEFLVDVQSLQAFKEEKSVIFDVLIDENFKKDRPQEIKAHQHLSPIDFYQLEQLIRMPDGEMHVSHFLTAIAESNLSDDFYEEPDDNQIEHAIKTLLQLHEKEECQPLQACKNHHCANKACPFAEENFSKSL